MKKWVLAAGVVVLISLAITYWLINQNKPQGQQTGSNFGVAPKITLSDAGNYLNIDPPVVTNSGDKVEVIEFFWFGCPHCFAFEPSIHRWNLNKPDYVTFIREAPPLNPSWLPHSKAFYAARMLGVEDQIIEPLFNAIHLDDRPLRNSDAIGNFVKELGIDHDDFLKAMESSEVEKMIRHSILLAKSAGLTGVPTVVIDGKYSTSTTLAGSHEGIIEVVNQLAEQSR